MPISLNKVHFFRNSLFFCCLCTYIVINGQAQNQKDLPSAANCTELYGWLYNGDDKQQRLDGQTLSQPDAMVAWYVNRACKPAWYNAQNKLATIDTLITILQQNSNNTQHLSYLQNKYNEIISFYEPLGLFNYTTCYKIDLIASDAAIDHALWLNAQRSGDEEALAPEMRWIITEQLARAVENNALSAFFEQLKTAPQPEQTPPVNDQTAADAQESVANAREVAQLQTNPYDTLPTNTAPKDTALFNRTKQLKAEPKISLFGRQANMPQYVAMFYQQRDYTLAWQAKGNWLPLAKQLLSELQKAYQDGLSPNNYHVAQIEKILLQTLPSSPQTQADADMLLTDAALTFAYHLRMGKFNPARLPFAWNITQGNANWTDELQKALNANNIANLFQQMRPQQDTYKHLKAALNKYQSIQKKGEWETIVSTEKIKQGTKSETVRQIRKRLSAEMNVPQYADSGRIDTVKKNIDNEQNIDITQIIGFEQDKAIIIEREKFLNSNKYDQTLRKIVAQYQRQHGLPDDGLPGTQTYEEMNVTVQHRITQLKLALEMWRWLPADLGQRHIQVNIPAYLLYLVENKNKTSLTHKVCVGQTIHKTPLFSDKMQYLELNPYWTAPPSIAAKELLPAVQKGGVAYLKRNRMKVFQADQPVSPYQVKWNSYKPTYFPYTIRQEPGKGNALGNVKFLFPNAFNVYLHDTQSKSLFNNHQRAYSHGCIRLDKPLDFAQYLLAKEDPKWTRPSIDKIVASAENKRIYLNQQIPVYLFYFTAWANDKGEVFFYKDIYGYEKKAIETMRINDDEW